MDARSEKIGRPGAPPSARDARPSPKVHQQDERVFVAKALRRLHDLRAVSETPHLLAAGVNAALIIASIAAWNNETWILLVPCWLLLAWFAHASLARLHEAVHDLLSRSRRRNEAWGIAIGTIALTPMTVYRYVHRQHHQSLGGRRDPEFWPYNRPETSRLLRRSYALAEVLLGVLVTPFLYTWRTFAAWSQHSRRVRLRLVSETALALGFWTALIAASLRYGWWPELVVAHIVPAWLTGIVQTLRKFCEHIGRHGDSIPAMTRTVAYRGPIGRFASALQLHHDHHGTHHRWPRIPYRNLPEATALMRRVDPTEPFKSHLAAFRDTLPSLLDPKVGPQWL